MATVFGVLFCILHLCCGQNNRRDSYPTTGLNFIFPFALVDRHIRDAAHSRCRQACSVTLMTKDLDSAQDLSFRLAKSLNSWKREGFSNSSTKPGKSESIQSQVTNKAALERSTEKPKPKVDVFGSKIRLQSTRAGKGGKTVTTLKGLENAPKEEAERILKSIKHKLSVGGKIGENGVLEIQGDQVSIILEYLSGTGYKDVKRG